MEWFTPLPKRLQMSHDGDSNNHQNRTEANHETV